MKKTALIGTAKGLIVYDFVPDEKPVLRNVHFVGFSVNMVYVDERTDKWWIGVSHKHWGQKLHFSTNAGLEWHEAAIPSFKGVLFPNGEPAKLRQIWCMAHGGGPNELWLGTDPGGLFHSDDNGKTFELVKSLWEHPSRSKPGQWFGAGSDHPFIHSILVDPADPDHVYIGVSCAGIFETTDGGKNWNPKNKGLKAAYLPNPNVEIGHDPHQLHLHPKNNKILWQQNHCGVFYTRNGGELWQDVSGKEGVPNYGFAIAIDEEEPAKAWVIPVENDEQRIAPDLALRVYQTSDFGESWESVSTGLPQENVFDIVLRQAFAKRGDLFVFGTTNGNVYYSFRKGIEWHCLTSNLTKVNSILII